MIHRKDTRNSFAAIGALQRGGIDTWISRFEKMPPKCGKTMAP